MTSALFSPSYQAARQHAAFFARDLGLIVVSGHDRASYLQGLLTNDIEALHAGHGCYASYLTAQGRMITDLRVYELGDVVLLALPPSTKDTVLTKLDQFIFSEDVQLGDVTTTFGVFAVVGPDAPSVVAAVLGCDAGELDRLPEYGNARRTLENEPVIVLRTADTGLSGVDLVVPRQMMDAVRARLAANGAVELDAATAEIIRVEGGVPIFGRDMDEDTIPLEAGIESRAISFTKGCYVGQEVIIRVLHRGHGRVARKLVGLAFDGADAPPAGTTLQVDGKEIGVVTSSAVSPTVGRPIALGYVKRDFVEPGTKVTTSAGVVADVSELPFVRA